METVDHHGRTTAYRRIGRSDVRSGSGAGRDSPTLYVHGSGATHQLWSLQYAPDGPAHPAIALDLSGHGESDDVDVDPGPETLEAYAADVLAVARSTDARVLVGNSMGGAVVLHVALETDFEPEALVFAGTGARLAVAEPLGALLDRDFGAAVEFLHEPDRLFHDPPTDVREESMAQLRATGREVTRRDFLTCDRFDVRDRLSEVSPPTLAVCGEHDRLTPPAYHEYLASEVRRGTLMTIPDAAHVAMVERPRAFNAAVERFLGESLD